MSQLFTVTRLLIADRLISELYGKENYSCLNCMFIISDCFKYTICGYRIW